MARRLSAGIFRTTVLILVIFAFIGVCAKKGAAPPSMVNLGIPMPAKAGMPFSLSIPIISGVAG
ncbi:hypothetical protein V3C99_010115 [Haemonchus contortus]|uniref:Lipoprotein n=1 Tax=Haemonchus contortus TaxID=6289 RepID=A0A7I4Z5C3_HAECO